MDTIDVAYRGYAEYKPAEKRSSGNTARSSERKPKNVLVFDTETTTDTQQQLNFGFYRYLRLGDDGTYRCLDEGLFYADDLPERYPVDFDLLAQYAQEHDLKLYACADFIKEVFLKAAYYARATVVGFNLPFDISRIAVDWSDARGEYRGGFSFVLSTYEDAATGKVKDNPFVPRIRVKNLDNTKSLIAFTSPHDDAEERYKGKFLDLRTLAFALTSKKYTLESACEAFNVPHHKLKVAEHGIITPDYIDYARNDVRITAELFDALLRSYLTHPIDIEPHRLFSPASLGKAYLNAMGIEPLLDKNPDFPKEILGYCMEAYYGGRAECRIRKMPVPVVYCDFTSMYPTVNGLMGLWDFIISERISVIDATDDVCSFVERISLADMFDAALWRSLCCVVEVLPDGDIFPVRGRYDADGQSYNIGNNYFTSDAPRWYMLPDVVASKLLTGKTPKILRAYRFVPEGKQVGLRPLALAGKVNVNPAERDFFLSVIEERKRTSDKDAQQALKILANATSYGIYAEMVRKELAGDTKARVEVFSGNDRFFSRVEAPEENGRYCFPPISSLITSAARLMLALLECCVTERGGSYAMCDTDSMAIVAAEQSGLIACAGGKYQLPDGVAAIKTLSWEETHAIINRFASLNPYDTTAIKGSVLRMEDKNFDAGNQRQLWCYAIAAKRYTLFTRDTDGKLLELVEAKEHGLGHILNPKAPITFEKDALEAIGDDDDEYDTSALPWMREIWALIVKEALGESIVRPGYFARPAITRLAITSTHLTRNNAAHQLRPFTFVLLGHERGTISNLRKQKLTLIAPFEKDQAKWSAIEWIDIYSGERFTVGEFDAELFAHRKHREAYLKPIGEVYREYKRHPEHKSAGADGKPCQRHTQGLLSRRHVTAGERHVIGKESNKVQRVALGEYQRLEEVQLEYQQRHCAICDKDISGLRADAVVCSSRSCEHKYQRYGAIANDNRRCIVCGTGISALPRKTKCCSIKCKKIHSQIKI